MSMTQTNPTPTAPVASAPKRRRKDGLIGLWGRLRHRDESSYETWLEERDMTIITATLMRLSERQLNRIGLSRSTLALDVEDLALRAQRHEAIGHEVLELVRDSGAQDSRAFAAE